MQRMKLYRDEGGGTAYTGRQYLQHKMIFNFHTRMKPSDCFKSLGSLFIKVLAIVSMAFVYAKPLDRYSSCFCIFFKRHLNGRDKAVSKKGAEDYNKSAKLNQTLFLYTELPGETIYFFSS